MVVFVAVMMAIVAGLDYGFAKAVLFVFGERRSDTSTLRHAECTEVSERA